MTNVDAVLGRLREKQSVVVSGVLPQLDAPGLAIVRVRCDGAMSSVGPVERAARRLAQVLGAPTSRSWMQRGAVAIRRRLLGDLGPDGPELDLAFLARRAADVDASVALVFDGVDRADRASVESLARVVQNARFVPMPIAFVFGSSPEGAARELYTMAEAAWGDGVSLTASEGATGTATEAATVMDTDPTARTGARRDPHDLSDDLVRVLRGVFVLGMPFDAGLLAELLETSRTSVLETLQRAADQGMVVVDHGDDGLVVPAVLVETAGATMLPALARHYARRAARLLTEPSAPERKGSHVAAAPPVVVSSPPIPVDPEPSASAAPSNDATSQQSYRPPAPAAVLAHQPPDDETTEEDDRIDLARAGHHLEVAGDVAGAVARYVEAATALGRRGDGARALMLLTQARDLLADSPTSPSMARVTLETARLLWRNAELGSGATLASARELAREARVQAGPHPEPALAADLAVVLAGIDYDIGDVASLDEALAVLTATSRALLEVGDAVRAAQLLNDQAAIHLRAGDSVQAMHLLVRSRDLFEALLRTNPDDPVAQLEVAETDHLIARVPLHAKLVPGKEQEALSLSVDHAIASERTYRKLGRPVEVARVLETMGRLETKRGRYDRADDALGKALELSRALGDVTGLARTTGAMSALLCESGSFVEALALLGDSIEFNEHEGSPLGLAFNRRALETLQARAAEVQGDTTADFGPRSREVVALLRAADELVGVVALPYF